MTNINLCKTKGAEVVICSSYCWFYGLPEELLNKLADKRPHLFYSLRKQKKKKKENSTLNTTSNIIKNIFKG